MEGNEELFQKIVELLVVAGYTRARSQSLCPFDKLTGGLVWCINGCDVDLDIDHFYDDNAAPEYKQKVCEAIEKALHVMECPYPLQAHQVQRLDYSAVYHVVQWLAKCAVSDQVSRLASAKKIDHPIDGKVEVRHEPVLLRKLMEEKKMNEQLKEQRKDLQSKILKKEELRRDQENEHSELCLNIKRLEKLESEGAGKFSQKLSSSLLWNKVSHEEKYGYESSCKKKEMEPPESTKDHKSIEDNLTGSKTSKVGLDKELEKSVEELKLLKKDMAKKNQQFLNLRHKVDELPTHLELMQYERCFMELYLGIQSKLQETRNYFATYNAVTEANELTLKEISLLDSITAQFEEVKTSQVSRAKLVASMSGIAKGVNQKVEKVEARLFAERSVLSALQKKRSQLVAERRRYENLMQLFQEECVKNEVLRSSMHRTA